MKYMELPKIEADGRAVRIRPDRVDVIDEIVEEYETEDSIAAREEVRANNAMRRESSIELARSRRALVAPTPILEIEPEPVMAERKVTLVFVQGRRNPWRVSTPAQDVEDMLQSWAQTGRFSEQEDEEQWPE